MKVLKNSIIFLIIFNVVGVLAQQNPKNTKELANVYSDYFSLNRESVFLHLNKTKVLPGEDIWFAAYAYSPQFYLPNRTTNLHVNLYNSEGKLMEAKTVYIKNGSGAGYFKLDPEKYASGEYLIRASTKYMENFREDRSFSQTFSILGETESPEISRKFDLQLLPEGGHLVTNVINSVGVKLIDNSGKGVSFKQGKVLNGEEQVINTFQSNRFGLSQFKITPKADENYTVLVELEGGKVIQEPVMKPERKGIVMSSTTLKDKILFSIKTNQTTYNNMESKSFLFAFHKDGTMKAFNFTIPQKGLTANLTLTKDALFPGVNIITIFTDDMEPILERMVFNRNAISRKDITASYNKRELDSLIINLNSPDSLGMHSLSISVLPAGTKSYHPDHNIFSAFCLKPYIKGNLENGAYYFSEEVEKRRRNYDLNLLLLTQGWTKYSWRDIFNNTPVEHFEPEQGFTLSGKLNNRNEKTDKRIYIGSKSNGISAIVKLDENGAFLIENLFLKDSTTVSFGVLNERNDNMSDPAIAVNILPKIDNENITPPEFIGVRLVENEDGKFEEQNGNITEKFIIGAEELKAVILQTQVQNEDEKQLVRERQLDARNVFGQTDIISEEEANTYIRLGTLLRIKGFILKNGNIYSRRELMRHPLNIDSLAFGLPAQPVNIFINGTLQQVIDPRYILDFYTRDIKSIYTSKTNRGGGAFVAGPGGVIKIVTKKDYGKNAKAKPTTTSVIIENGFAPSKEFYTPKYSSYSHSLFEKYGAIDWFPHINLENGKANLKIFNTMQPKVKLFIAGMTEEGALISEEIVVETN